MISEQFAESMVLLKDLLGWTPEEMTWKNKNPTTVKRSTISNKARSCLEEWNKADMMLYDHFKAIFERKKQDFGRRRMSSELKEMEKLNAEKDNICRGGHWNGRRDNEWPTKYDCKLADLNELSFLNLLRSRQRNKARLFKGTCCPNSKMT